MCGIFGCILSASSSINLKNTLDKLYIYSESRGKEASGLMALDDDEIVYIKDAIPATHLIKKSRYRKILEKLDAGRYGTKVAIGHSRLVTNGERTVNINNQPVRVGGCIGVHNGIITNVSQLWSEETGLSRKSDLDTEILVALLDKSNGKETITSSVEEIYRRIEGVANIAILYENYDIVLLATNNGSLYYVQSDSDNSIIFASEKYILSEVVRRIGVPNTYSVDRIRKLEANKYLIISLGDISYKEYSALIRMKSSNIESKKRTIVDKSSFKEQKVRRKANDGILNTYAKYEKKYKEVKNRVDQLKRCKKCILPETMPFIEFDSGGICNYCNNYSKHTVRGEGALGERLKKTKNDYDCVVTLSGGRDSCYGLHYVKEVLGLNPVSYTYDWGMVTDLARRNQMRMCGKLGVEHILVSADIQKKRENIRKNVKAWLSNPQLGMIPIFMAGDKQYFYWANKIAERTGCSKIVLCENLLETTRFKSGFCGIRPIHRTENTYTLSIRNKFQMTFYYALNFMKTPGYINSSLFNTAIAFSSYYVMKHDYVNLFDYIEWDEKEVSNTIIDTYKWETSPDTKSTWRIGDGTASFYNYIYYTLAGLTENDTFRSNQIRQGKISREKAIVLSEEENAPRFESILWYLDMIGLEFDQAMNRINSSPKLYK